MSDSDIYVKFDDCNDNLNVLNDDYDMLYNVEDYSGHIASIRDDALVIKKVALLGYLDLYLNRALIYIYSDDECPLQGFFCWWYDFSGNCITLFPLICGDIGPLQTYAHQMVNLPR